MDLREYWRSLRSGWWLCLLGLLLGGLVAGAVLVLTTPVYTTQTRMFVSTTGNTDLATAVQGSQFTQERISSYATYLTDQQVMNAVIGELHLPMTAEELAKEITVEVPSGTVILDVTVTDESPQRAVAIGQALGLQYPVLLGNLEQPAGATVSPVKVTVTAQPLLPTSPSSPNRLVDLAAGLALGLLVGAVAAILRDRFDTRVRGSEEAATAGSAPPLGLIVEDSRLAKEKVLSPDAVSASAEEFRQLRTNLDFVDVDQPPRVIVVSSPTAGEGKTTVAVNLAVSLAHSGRSVVLVEADLRRPRVTRYLGLISGAGLTQILNGSAEVDDVRQTVYGLPLSVLGSGPRPPNPGELLASGQMRSLLEKLRADFDLVIVDAPPLLPVADTTGLATLVDGVLLCARWGHTRREELAQARRRLTRVNARVLGVVLTMAPRRAAAKEGYGHGYAYDDGKPAPVRRISFAAQQAAASLPKAEQAPAGDAKTTENATVPVNAGSPGNAKATGGSKVTGDTKATGLTRSTGLTEATEATEATEDTKVTEVTEVTEDGKADGRPAAQGGSAQGSSVQKAPQNGSTPAADRNGSTQQPSSQQAAARQRLWGREVRKRP